MSLCLLKSILILGFFLCMWDVCRYIQPNSGQHFQQSHTISYRVDFGESIKVAPEGKKSRKRRLDEAPEHQRGESMIATEDLFHPVYCKVCSTRLGLYDSEEVFHFCEVIASDP